MDAKTRNQIETRPADAVIVIEIRDAADDDILVSISWPEGWDEPEFSQWMAAAEYLLSVVASRSPAGYEKALDLLRKGAMTYRNLGPM